MPPPALKSKIGKSTLSAFLRTNCDRELYFSLFASNAQKDLIAAGMPAPLSARPNIQLITRSGVEFEAQEMADLITLMGAVDVKHVKNAKGGFADLDLLTTLAGATAPAYCLQPAVEPEDFKSDLLNDFELTAAEATKIPKLTGMRPDIVIVRPRKDLLWEVLPGGKREQLQAADTRMGLSVVDVKNTAEGNKSYAAEVVLYSIVLARWLRIHGLEQRFFVSDECFLWTHGENTALGKVAAGASAIDKLTTLIAAMEPVHFPVIAPSVIKFFKEDLPRVVSVGSGPLGWAATEYHVGPRCSNCDWLGFREWLAKADQTLFDNNKDWYCRHAASTCKHLSQLPNLSKGARKVLEQNGIADLTGVAGLTGTAPQLKAHSILKKERSNIPHKATAILTNTHSTDSTATLAGLAGFAELTISIVVNFDSAAGLLTGLAVKGILSTPPVAPATTRGYHNYTDFAVVVEEATHSSEWSALLSFLSHLDYLFQDSKKRLGSWPSVQMMIWEHRQFEELCGAVGRHLTDVLAPAKGSVIPALAWLFPPPELIELDAAAAPYFVFVSEIAKRVLRVPQAHALTLHGVHEHYHHPKMLPWFKDNYFIDPMGNGIPRERIFEVWKNTGHIYRGPSVITKGNAIGDYKKALSAQCSALASIAAQLKNDFKGQLKGKAVTLDPRTLRGAPNVAFDSKLWIQWAAVEYATSALEYKAQLTLPSETLEAGYQALVLTKQLSATSPVRGLYEVSSESAEAKLDAGGAYFVIGKTTQPGFPLQTPKSLGMANNPAYASHHYTLPLYQLVVARLITLDRSAKTAEIEFAARSSTFSAIVNDLINGGFLPTNDFFLMEGKPFNDTEEPEAILKAVGHPSCAIADPTAIKAMGYDPSKPKPAFTKAGTDPITPIARLLWEADKLATTPTRSSTTATALASRAKALAGKLDPSQEDAITRVAQKQLSLIWGPPGTGKTSTLTAYLLAIIEEAVLAGVPKKILLTGPNYRAVEVLITKLLQGLDIQAHLASTVFMVYSRSRPVVPLVNSQGNAYVPPPHVTASGVSLGDPAALAAIYAALTDTSVSIFGTSAHNALKLAGGGPLSPVFDLVVIDESSQVPVNLALRPLATLKASSEIVIAGDPKQMPPIQSLEPPVGAEHLVGGIHTYLTTRFPTIIQNELLVNYRSGTDLVAFARTLGYPVGLLPSSPDRRIQLIGDPGLVALPAGLPSSPAWVQALDPNKAVCTLLHNDDQSSQANLGEAKMVAAITYLLSQTLAMELAPLPATATLTLPEFILEGIGIVTPHKAQRALILEELAKLFPAIPFAQLQSSVDTVERFQGGERYCVIVSFGVGDVDVIQGEEEFLLQMERANVAISRAMGKCIVIMPKSLAYHLPDESRVAKTAAALKSYVQEFCSHRQAFPLGGDPVGIELRWK